MSPKTKLKKKSSKKVYPEIGWREYLSLPDLKVPRVKVKVDTGARTSALHVSKLSYIQKRGKTFVQFEVHPKQRSLRPTIKCEAPLLEYRVVKSSNGARSVRPVIETTVSVGDWSWSIELTLVNRDQMGFRMLLGRSGVLTGVRVNPHRSFIQSQRSEKRKRASK